jgi:hypothetical protein
MMCITGVNTAAIEHSSSIVHLSGSELVRHDLCIVPVHTGSRLDNIGQNMIF